MKQQRFAELVIMGVNPSDAYRAAYDAKRSKPETVAVEAWRLLHTNPNVTQMIERGRAAATQSAITTRATLLERMERVNERAFEVLTSENSETVSGSALSAFLKTYDILKDNVPQDRFYFIATAEREAQSAGDVFGGAFGNKPWFSDGCQGLPPIDWDFPDGDKPDKSDTVEK